MCDAKMENESPYEVRLGNHHLSSKNNKPSPICQYSSMTTRLSGHISRISSFFFVSQVSREISKQKNIQI